MSIKKLLLTVLITLLLVCSFSISASAAEPLITYDGVSEDGKVHFAVDISDYQPYCYATAFHIVQNDTWYMVVFYTNGFVSGVSPDNIDVSFGRYNDRDCLCVGFNNPLSVQPFNRTYCIVYSQDGTIVYSGGSFPKKQGWCMVGAFFTSDWFSFRESALVDYIQPIFNTCFYNGNFYSSSLNLTSFNGDFWVGTSKYRSIPITGFQGFYYETADGLTNFHGTDLGSLVEGSGIIEPVYDDNGNIINYNYTYQFDLGLNDSEVPGALNPDDYPDKESELLNNLPGISDNDINSVNSHLSSNSLNSNAIQWWYARFSDVTSNNKFRSVMLSMLSLSVIAFILNKRGVL